MQRKGGLLPKWLFVNTAIRTALLFLGDRMKVSSAVPYSRIFVYSSLFLAFVRVVGIKKINPLSYTLVGMSYILEVVWFVTAWRFKCFSPARVAFEVVTAVFSLGWMVFLYPYYLVKKNNFTHAKKS